MMTSVKFMLCLLMLLIPANAAVTLNQVENFTTLGGWGSGSTANPNPPAILADSGPLGIGDSALKITANGGSAAGSRLVALNTSAWAGDYSGQGIVSLAASLRNMGATSLSIRVAFNGPGGWFVTTVAPVAAFVGWTQQVFDIRPASLLSAGGANAATTMAAVSETRILHSTTVDFKGADVSNSFLVDNLRAVPEPHSCTLLLIAGTLLCLRKR
jgi:hypothetical protein